MKRYPSFDAYYADQSAARRPAIRALRALVKRTRPHLQETVKWGNGVWVLEQSPICYVYTAKDHVQFGFFNGAALKDPKKLLIGQGNYVRHIKVYKADEIQPRAYAALLKQAGPARPPKKPA